LCGVLMSLLHAALPARTAAARRLPAGDADLARAAGLWRLPLLLAMPGLSFTDAYFEAMSGLTTTGATVLTGLDRLPLSVNVWRCFMVLVGGHGHHRAGGGHPAAAGRGRHAALQGRERPAR
jgi:Trk-type K+ transport system membrane component